MSGDRMISVLYKCWRVETISEIVASSNGIIPSCQTASSCVLNVLTCICFVDLFNSAFCPDERTIIPSSCFPVTFTDPRIRETSANCLFLSQFILNTVPSTCTSKVSFCTENGRLVSFVTSK